MEPSSPEHYDNEPMSEGEESVADGQDMKQEDGFPQTSPSTSSNALHKVAPAARPIGHAQKRRRVTRACDECRRKKIKCDGKQPCTHCTVYSYGE